MTSTGAQPAFALDFDPTVLFTQALTDTSADQDFDRILGELDLELAGDNTNQLVHHITQGIPTGQGVASSDAGGLRELFGIQQGLSFQQQPPQTQQPVAPQALQQHQNAHSMQQAQQAGMQQLLQQQQQLFLQQQLQFQKEQQQQQQTQGLGVVYQLPSPFMQPVSAVPTGMPLPGMAMYTDVQQPMLNGQLFQQPQMQLQQQFLVNGIQHSASGTPMFTFSAMPAPGQMQQPAQMFVADPAASVSAGSAPGMSVMPGAWPAYAQNGTLAGAPSPSAGTTISPGAQISSEGGGLPPAGAAAAGGGLPPAAAAAAGAQRRGRGRTAAPAAPGAEKPKGPSQRFRERQKATISTLEAEVSQKLAELQVLADENEMLKLRSAVLEAVTSGREYQMKMLKEHGPPTFEVADSPHSNHSSGPLCHWGSGKSNAAASDSDPTQAGIATNDSPRSASISSAATGTTGTTMDAAAAGASPTSAAAAAAAGDGCPADLFQCAEDGACTVDVQQRSIRCIRKMTSEDITMHWRQFVQDVSEELLTSDEKEEQQRLEAGMLGFESSCRGGPKAQQQEEEAAASDDSAFTMPKICRWCGCTNSVGLHVETGCSMGEEQQQEQKSAAAAAAGGAGSNHADERMVELVNKYSYMTKFVALLNPGVLYSLFGRNLDTGEAVAYNDEHWRNVVTRLHLSKQQVTFIMACSELYFSSLCSLMQERKALHEALVKADGQLSECQRRLLGIDGGVDQMALLDRLSSNLKKEHVLRIMLNCFVWGRILTAVQFAKTAVYSHPFFPDVHAMVCVLYEDHWKKSPDCSGGKVFPHRIAAAKAALAKAPVITV